MQAPFAAFVPGNLLVMVFADWTGTTLDYIVGIFTGEGVFGLALLGLWVSIACLGRRLLLLRAYLD